MSQLPTSPLLPVIPAKAGTQCLWLSMEAKSLGPCLCGDDDGFKGFP